MAKRRHILAELWQFVRENRAYWLVPIIIVLILLGVVVVLGKTSAAPFIYTMF